MKLLSIAIIFIAANTIMARAGAQETYKCGNSYSQTPCPGGQKVDADDARSAEQQAQTRAAEQELDPVRRASLFVRMNDLVVAAGYTLPLMHRPNVDAASNRLQLSLSGWGNATGSIADWTRA